ncbi:MAG: helix-turn-helix transcriptional regulator [Chloroflexi bacterium]|nr:helix-turn-helix transcriptional regulator [Chloroflexota bacterium]
MYEGKTNLGTFLAGIMRRKQLNNVTLASMAGVSEGVIRNLLKHGIEARAKDPDPRTLRAVAHALGIDTAWLFRLAGYLSPLPDANSVRAEYVADVFDELSQEKQDVVMSVLEAMAESREARGLIQDLQRGAPRIDLTTPLTFPAILRELANQLIAHYRMSAPGDVEKIEPDVVVLDHRWQDLPGNTQARVRALIRHKLSLEFDPTMLDEEW